MECDAEDDSALFHELSGPAPTPIDADGDVANSEFNWKGKIRPHHLF